MHATFSQISIEVQSHHVSRVMAAKAVEDRLRKIGRFVAVESLCGHLSNEEIKAVKDAKPILDTYRKMAKDNSCPVVVSLPNEEFMTFVPANWTQMAFA